MKNRKKNTKYANKVKLGFLQVKVFLIDFILWLRFWSLKIYFIRFVDLYIMNLLFIT